MRIVLTVLMLTIFSGLSYACSPNPPKPQQPNVTVINNTTVNNTTVEETNVTNVDQTQNRENQAGPGLDLVLWENKAETVSVETQTRFDVNNSRGAWSNYVVCKINLWKMANK